MSDTHIGKWQVESITRADVTTPVPATAGAWITFSVSAGANRIRLSDTVNTISGRFEPVRSGFTIREASTTLVYYSGGDPVRLLITAAFQAVTTAGRVQASIRDDRLTVTAGEFRIVFTRHGTR